jgi:hypothetical protein
MIPRYAILTIDVRAGEAMQGALQSRERAITGMFWTYLNRRQGELWGSRECMDKTCGRWCNTALGGCSTHPVFGLESLELTVSIFEIASESSNFTKLDHQTRKES